MPRLTFREIVNQMDSGHININNNIRIAGGVNKEITIPKTQKNIPLTPEQQANIDLFFNKYFTKYFILNNEDLKNIFNDIPSNNKKKYINIGNKPEEPAIFIKIKNPIDINTQESTNKYLMKIQEDTNREYIIKIIDHNGEKYILIKFLSKTSTKELEQYKKELNKLKRKIKKFFSIPVLVDPNIPAILQKR